MAAGVALCLGPEWGKELKWPHGLCFQGVSFSSSVTLAQGGRGHLPLASVLFQRGIGQGGG